MSRIIKCECCGLEFEAKRIDTKCCSKQCTTKEWRKNNPEKSIASVTKWKKENPEKVKAYNNKWKNENLEKALAPVREWRKNNPEKFKEYRIKWNKENPEKVKANMDKQHRRQTYRRLGYPEELLEIKELQYQIKKEIKNQLNGEETK